MGFYLRKSLSVGPLRFNLSKSGIGVSAGIKGFRVGAIPRGNYVHMGRGGLYYRATLPGSQKTHQFKNELNEPWENIPILNQQTHESLKEIESGSVLNMTDSSSASLLEEINGKLRKIRIRPIVATISIIGVLVIINAGGPALLSVLAFLVGLGITIFTFYRDQLSKSVVLFYDLEDNIEKAYQALHDAFEEISRCSKIWHIEAEGQVKDWKRHSGANSVVQRKAISLKKKLPPYLKTNIAVPMIPIGRQALYFFPDRLLVFDKSTVGAVSYDTLEINLGQTRFIESGTVPGDANVVDHTWKYVNKKGGPDKRFKDNRELPIALYEDVYFKSNSGLNELIQLSRLNSASKFKEAIEKLARLAKP